MGISGNLFITFLFLVVLTGITAFFASSEIAIISLNDKKIIRMAEQGDKKAKLLAALISEPSRFLATIQVGVTLSALMASAIATESFADGLSSLIKSTGIPASASLIKVSSVIIITILLAFFTLVFGELVPKRLGMYRPEPIAMSAAQPLSVLLRAVNPFVRLLTFSTNSIIRLLGKNLSDDDGRVTEEEIRLMVDIGEEKGTIQSAEKKMIDNIFEFNDTVVGEIMTHRMEVLGIPLDARMDEVMHLATMGKYSRMPVYAGNIDNIVGILNVKDLLYEKTAAPENFQLQTIIRKPYFIPQSKRTDELFLEFQKNKTHLAVVIDEYGGTAGIITMEDLIEAVFGNIFDEYDEEDHEIEKIDDNTYLFDGTVSLERVKELLEVELPSEEYDTLGGFVMEKLGRIPEAGENPQLSYENLTIQVEAVDEKRISRIRIVRAR